MQATSRRADSGIVSNEERGHALAQRRARLGIVSFRQGEELARKMGRTVTRGQIAATEKGTASENAYLLVEAFYDAVEERMGFDDAPEVIVPPLESDQVEFHIIGNFGVDVTVRGPVSNLAELQASVTDLIREIKGAPDDEQRP